MRQPGMLVVDRWVQGEYENYLTPEQNIPPKALPVPWESCITMGNAWGWVKDDKYNHQQSASSCLSISPPKAGAPAWYWPEWEGRVRTEGLRKSCPDGKVAQANGEAIYETTPVEPYSDGRVAYTARGDKNIYAIYMPAKDEQRLPAHILVKTKLSGKLKVTLLASKQELSYTAYDGIVIVSIPEQLRPSLAKQEAVVIKVAV